MEFSVITYTLLSVVGVSVISFMGAFALAMHSKLGRSALHFLVSFAAGALLGDVFIHLLPELAEEGVFDLSISLTILGSMLGFFILEKFIHLHHHHDEIEERQTTTHPMAALNLIGDGFHNFIDGMIIAGSYMIDVQLGIATTIAVVLHEIPQEIGDFSVLLYAGLSKSKALFYNFLSALMAVAGAVLALVVGDIGNGATILTAIGIGTFIYIAAADLIPEIHRSKHKAWPQFLAMLLGIVIMASLLVLE